MFQAEIRLKIAQELARGEEARRQGLEGRARVCARRAAGLAARAYLEGRGLAADDPSSMDLLERLAGLPELSEGAQRAVELLRMRVNEAYELPVEADLLAEARGLVAELEGGSGMGAG